MIKSDYLWMFHAAALKSGLDGAFSLEYHIPALKLKPDPRDLPGARVWLVVRHGGGTFLFALVTPSSVEIYNDGMYNNDYLLRANPLCTMRFFPRHEACDSWRLPHWFSDTDEIRLCSDKERITFLDLVKTNRRVSFGHPTPQILEVVPRTRFEDPERAVPDQLMLTLNSLAFGDITRSRSFPGTLSAFAGIAVSVLCSAKPSLNRDLCLELMAKLDPMPINADTIIRSPSAIRMSSNSLPPQVDMFLEEIDPEQITPRTFVANDQSYAVDWLDKTNEAEALHESILKDVAIRMKTQGFRIFRSRSFDLLADDTHIQLLWEIKSANANNCVAQGEQGIIQLLRYSTALNGGRDGIIRSLLLIQYVNQGMLNYLSAMAKRTCVELWAYDLRREWPSRIFNCKDQSFPEL